MNHYLGIDVSTTATKALLMSEVGGVVAVGRSEYEFSTPRPLWSEQSPELWWDATVSAVGDVLAASGVPGADIRGIGMTGQMHGLVLLDNDAEVLRPAILWNDQRTQAECDEIRRLVGRDRLIAVTGNDALTGFTAPKILWVRNHEPDLYDRVSHILLPKDYVRFRLTSEFASDRAGGSGTILFDLAARDWSSEITDSLGISDEWLPQTFEGTDVTGFLTASAADQLGLAAGTAVFGGGGDQAANGVGVGAVDPGVVAMSIGTSGVVFAPTAEPVIEPEGRLHAFCHAVPGRWHLMGVMLSAAGSFRWFRDTVARGSTYAELDAAADAVAPGSNGLVFLPYLSGERTPHPDPLARAAFVGLTVRHDIGHLARSVMEGVAFGLRDSFELISATAPIREVRASGGGASSEVWLHIIADVLGVPVRVTKTAEGAAHGAALLAATGAGEFGSVAEASRIAVELDDPREPSAGADRYDAAYALFRGLYPMLKDTFHDLAAFDD